MLTGTAPHHVASSRRELDFHPEIQGLRAVAVLLVVLYHLWPNRLPGGFVGVDVFFVISGYLITSHIHREVVATGTLSLRRFWARRIRRLLPASFVVLALSLIAALIFLPATLWAQTARQIGASALYVQNWVLVADSVNYLAQDNVPTIAQHYWSLSVEEQFYVIWPLLVFGIVLLARRWGGSDTDGHRRWLFVALAVVAAASLAYSVSATADDQGVAYFATTTRIWEFAAGALLALAGIRRRMPALVGIVAGWMGLAAIVLAAFLFDGASMFPGWIALLPILGTVAVLAAGTSNSTLTAARWLSMKPATFIGDISYSVYLWHWPLIVILPFVTGVDLRTLDKVAIFVATIGLSWLSKTIVEDRMRTGALLAAAPWRSFLFAIVGMAVIVAGGASVEAEVDRRAVAAEVQTTKVLTGELATGCTGPGALDPRNDCESVVGEGGLIPAPEVVVKQNSEPLFHGCQTNLRSSGLATCDLGSRSTKPDRTIALVGDSHATQWFSAFDTLGKARNWRIKTFTKSSCPFTTAFRTLPGEQTTVDQANCLAWITKVREKIAADNSISQVYTAAFSAAYGWESAPGNRLDAPRTEGFHEVWKEWSDDGKDIFVIRDVPRTQGDNVPNCLAVNEDNPLACGMSRKEALRPIAIADAAETSDDTHVYLLDLTDHFCDATFCYPVVGNMIVYRDFSHISAEYAIALSPYLGRLVDQLLLQGNDRAPS